MHGQCVQLDFVCIAGVKTFPRTCLHVLISILDASVTARTTPYMMPPQPRLLEACFAMLYALCANTKTGEPVLNYLRTCSNFLARHLSSLQFGAEQNGTVNFRIYLHNIFNSSGTKKQVQDTFHFAVLKYSVADHCMQFIHGTKYF